AESRPEGTGDGRTTDVSASAETSTADSRRAAKTLTLEPASVVGRAVLTLGPRGRGSGGRGGCVRGGVGLGCDREPADSGADLLDREGKVLRHLEERHVGVGLRQQWRDEVDEPADDALAAGGQLDVLQLKAARRSVDDEVGLTLRLADLAKETLLAALF